MRKLTKSLICPCVAISLLIFLSITIPIEAAFATTYSQRLCSSNLGVTCIVVKHGDSWESLWPDLAQRHMAMEINHMNVPLSSGMHIAVPNQQTDSIVESQLPFAKNIGPQSTNRVIVSVSDQAWAAYNESGDLVRWGAVSTARGYCPDQGSKCETPRGTFTIFNKKGEDCVSSQFPLPKGGAPMPYCMHFKGGYALHGAPFELPGFNASHGCVRMLEEDAQWLNQDFVTVGSTTVTVEN